MPPVLSKIKQINTLTKHIVNGWIRNVHKIHKLQSIPNIIISICILYYHNEETWKISDKNGKCYEISPDKKYIKLFQHENHSIYGINKIFLNKCNKNKYKWDIKICQVTYLEDDHWINKDGIISVGLTSNKNDEFMYESDGTKIDIDGSSYDIDGVSEVIPYGDSFFENDTISVHLNFETKQIGFALNKIDQGIAYNIEDFDIEYLQLFIKTFALETGIKIVDFSCYK